MVVFTRGNKLFTSGGRSRRNFCASVASIDDLEQAKNSRKNQKTIALSVTDVRFEVNLGSLILSAQLRWRYPGRTEAAE